MKLAKIILILAEMKRFFLFGLSVRGRSYPKHCLEHFCGKLCNYCRYWAASVFFPSSFFRLCGMWMRDLSKLLRRIFGRKKTANYGKEKKYALEFHIWRWRRTNSRRYSMFHTIDVVNTQLEHIDEKPKSRTGTKCIEPNDAYFLLTDTPWTESTQVVCAFHKWVKHFAKRHCRVSTTLGLVKSSAMWRWRHRQHQYIATYKLTCAIVYMLRTIYEEFVN